MNFNHKVNPFSALQGPSMVGGAVFPGSKAQAMQSFSAPQGGSFKDVMGNLLTETNHTLNAPDELMNRALTTGDVDIHEIMIANTKADLAVNLASQVVTKVIQAYERVQQIQV
jgi:flagellar hook-basal body complex protein FliE